VQPPSASLLHSQTQTTIELPQGLANIYIGKPNDRLPPDIDVSGFANSEIVSRIHAQIRVEGADFFIEDMGSANGTYINHTPLLPGSRYRLRPDDRISLGKEDKVSFIFQMTTIV
jgi:pSer/pThr/pTyr-binding forkhead associated (FHA) protein